MKYQTIASKLNEELKKAESQKDILKVLSNLVDSLKKNNSLNFLSEILGEAENLASSNSTDIAVVETPISLNAEQKKKLKEKIEKLFGKDTDLVEKVNEELTGGIRIFYKDDLIDLSLNNQINLVAKTIKNHDDRK